MKYFSSQHLLILLFSLIMLASCSSSENTVVIEDAPISSESVDTTQQEDEGPIGPFKQLTIGENQAISSLDPLFVTNNGGLHALQLLYEGLVQFDENTEVVPALAKDWSVEDGDKTYRFNLKSDVFFHDNSIFTNGRGRRLVAADVKKTFERMAKSNVPGQTAQMFMDIKGFEPYYSEQHAVMMQSERQLNGISGIRAPNDSTIIFSLVEPDEQFLNKLASPFAVIYPQESVTANSFKAVGTGPFVFSQQPADSMYVFSQFDNYRISGQPSINRVDIITSEKEAALLNAMSRGEIQLIPQLGPAQISMILNSTGQLKSSLQGNYSIYENESSDTYYLRYNTNADVSQASVSNTLGSLTNSPFFSNISTNYVQVRWSQLQSESSSSLDSLSSTYSDNPFVRSFYNQLSEKLASNDIMFEINNMRVRNRNIPLFVDHFSEVQDISMRTTPPNTLATLAVKPLAIAQSGATNLKFNQLPWWIDLRNVNLSSTNSR